MRRYIGAAAPAGNRQGRHVASRARRKDGGAEGTTYDGGQCSFARTVVFRFNVLLIWAKPPLDWSNRHDRRPPCNFGHKRINRAFLGCRPGWIVPLRARGHHCRRLYALQESGSMEARSGGARSLRGFLFALQQLKNTELQVHCCWQLEIGAKQNRDNQNWKKNEFLAARMREFLTDETTARALEMLDYSGAEIEVTLPLAG